MKRFAACCLLLCAAGCGPDSVGEPASQPSTVKNTPTNSDGSKKKSQSPNITFTDIDSAIKVLLTSEDSAQEQKAIAWLGSQKAAAVGPLAKIMNDASELEKNRSYACRALGVVGAPAHDVLLAALASQDSLVRVNAAREIGRIKPASEKTIRALVGLIEHEDWQMRLNAIKGLGMIGLPANDLAIDPLLAVMHSTEENDTVRSEAKRAVKIINPRRTFQD